MLAVTVRGGSTRKTPSSAGVRATLFSRVSSERISGPRTPSILIIFFGIMDREISSSDRSYRPNWRPTSRLISINPSSYLMKNLRTKRVKPSMCFG